MSAGRAVLGTDSHGREADACVSTDGTTRTASIVDRTKELVLDREFADLADRQAVAKRLHAELASSLTTLTRQNGRVRVNVARLVKRHSANFKIEQVLPAISGAVRRVLKRHDDRAEVVMRVLEKLGLQRNFLRIAERGKRIRFAALTAHREALTHWRRQKRSLWLRSNCDEALRAVVDDREQSPRERLRSDVREAVDLLSARHALLIRWRFDHDLAIAEMSVLSGHSVRSISRWLHAAKLRLRVLLQKRL